MSQGFYRAFEDSFRGTREVIHHRLEVYRQFFEPLVKAHPDAAALDIGCGRGEWLEMLEDAGFKPTGIDLDEGMLAACREFSLNAFQGDGIAHLETVDDESQVIVSAFHVVEHVPFDRLDQLVRLAHQKLKPGGILILETPNPENVLVATQHFYLDPSHTRPIPSHLLDFICQFHGFARTKVIGLHESEGLRDDLNSRPSLLEVLGGSSRDYAVIAQKKGRKRITGPLDAAFQQEIGLKLEALTDRYDAGLYEQASSILGVATRAESSAVATHQRLNEVSRELGERLSHHDSAQAELNLAIGNMEGQLVAQAEYTEARIAAQAEHTEARIAAQAEHTEARFGAQADHNAWILHEFTSQLVRTENQLLTRIVEIDQTLYLIRNSRSWKVTAPLRWVSFQLDLLKKHGAISRTHALIRKILTPLARSTVRKIRANPELEKQLYRKAREMGLLDFARAIRRQVEPDPQCVPIPSASVEEPTIPNSTDMAKEKVYSDARQGPDVTELAGAIRKIIAQGR